MGTQLPLPPHYDADALDRVWRVPYQERALEAEAWAAEHAIRPASEDDFRVCLVAVDVQNTFCIPGFELFVAGRSGAAAVDDNRRLCEFVYRNLGAITEIVPTLDTHQPFQIFHAAYLVDNEGEHPAPYTRVALADIEEGRWRFNTAVAASLGLDPERAQRQVVLATVGQDDAHRLRARGEVRGEDGRPTVADGADHPHSPAARFGVGEHRMPGQPGEPGDGALHRVRLPRRRVEPPRPPQLEVRETGHTGNGGGRGAGDRPGRESR